MDQLNLFTVSLGLIVGYYVINLATSEFTPRSFVLKDFKPRSESYRSTSAHLHFRPSKHPSLRPSSNSNPPPPPSLPEPKFGVPPRISLKARLGNLLLLPLSFFHISPVFKPLKLSSLKKAASKMTKGLNDFGDTWYEAPYTETMEMVNEANYSPIGRAAANDFFLRR